MTSGKPSHKPDCTPAGVPEFTLTPAIKAGNPRFLTFLEVFLGILHKYLIVNAIN